MKVEASQGSQGAGGSQAFRSKKTMHFTKPSVEQLQGNYFLIAYDVFIISGKPRKLTPEEILELPVIISWKGPSFSFDTDEKMCFELLSKIIFDMNQMQDRRYTSFPMGM
jgi:hypothetical protein